MRLDAHEAAAGAGAEDAAEALPAAPAATRSTTCATSRCPCPRTKQSMRFGPQETAAGGPSMIAAEVLPAAPARAVPPLVPHVAVGAADEAVEAVRAPGGDCGRRREHAAEVLPAAPARAVPPLVPHRVVRPADEAVDAVRAPRDRGRRARQRCRRGPPSRSSSSRSTTCATCGCRCRGRSSPGGSAPTRRRPRSLGEDAAEVLPAEPRHLLPSVRLSASREPWRLARSSLRSASRRRRPSSCPSAARSSCRRASLSSQALPRRLLLCIGCRSWINGVLLPSATVDPLCGHVNAVPIEALRAPSGYLRPITRLTLAPRASLLPGLGL